MSLDLLTKSRLTAWRRCKRLHRLRYIDGWDSTRESEAITFGQLVHEGLEAFWTGQPLDLPAPDDPILMGKACEIMAGYIRHAWPDRLDYEVLAVEYPVTFPLLNPETMQSSRTYEMGAILDLVLRRKATGEIILVEHKTTGSDFSDDASGYWNRLAMDSQLSLYVIACEAQGWKVDRIIYDVIARPQLRQKLATPEEARRYRKSDGALDARQRDADESLEEFCLRLREDIDARPERYYARREIARVESEIRDGMLDTWEEAKAMRQAELSGRHPRNPDACHMYGTTCDFYDICAYGVDPSGSSLYVKRDRSADLERVGLGVPVSSYVQRDRSED